MEEKKYSLSIVIPAYKEEKRLHKIFEAIDEYRAKKDFLVEVIIVVDGSPDKTAEIAHIYADKNADALVIDRPENRGKGYSVKEGMLRAHGEYILFADADNSTPIKQVDKLLKFVPEYKVVIGSRYCEGGELAKPQPFYRILGSRGLNLIIQLLADKGIKDTQCGFKMFENKAAKEIFSRQTFERFSFDIEVLAIARKLGYKTKEVGIIWYDDPHSTVDPIKDGLRMLADAWKTRQNIISGKYR
jgi:dolichyl-phosphate beta-glucosyltransferase